MPVINWSLIAEAISFYKKHYTYIEVPWVVSPETIFLTLPRKYASHAVSVSNKEFNIAQSGITEGILVGSAEQSFLELEKRGDLKPGKYMACTPCFRNDAIDDLHQKTFMKVELYNNIVNIDEYDQMLSLALAFFKQLSNKVELVVTRDGHDIEIDGIEVGSYGIRQVHNLNWIYGTGVAEPRCSIAIKNTLV